MELGSRPLTQWQVDVAALRVRLLQCYRNPLFRVGRANLADLALLRIARRRHPLGQALVVNVAHLVRCGLR